MFLACVRWNGLNSLLEFSHESGSTHLFSKAGTDDLTVKSLHNICCSFFLESSRNVWVTLNLHRVCDILPQMSCSLGLPFSFEEVGTTSENTKSSFQILLLKSLEKREHTFVMSSIQQSTAARSMRELNYKGIFLVLSSASFKIYLYQPDHFMQEAMVQIATGIRMMSRGGIVTPISPQAAKNVWQQNESNIGPHKQQRTQIKDKCKL